MIEAQYYQIKCGGYIYCLSDHKFVEVEPSEEDKNDGVECEFKQNDRKVYLLVRRVKKDLEESFNPIKNLIYDVQLLKLWKHYTSLQENNIMVYGIKTDCLLIEEDITLLSMYFKFDTVIGGMNMEKTNQ